MKRTSYRSIVFLTVVAALVAGCSSSDLRQKIKYEKSTTLPPLEIPPDLSSLPGQERNPNQTVSKGTATYSEFTNKQQTTAERLKQAGGVVLPDFKNVRVKRAGTERWLVVQASPEDMWPKLREFVSQTGLLIDLEDPSTGLIRTTWADNRAKVGSGSQNFLSRWIGSLYSTGERDMYRIRLVRGSAPGTSEVFVVHYGMQEVVSESDGPGVKSTRWQRRPADPELEAEMLAQLMVYFGVDLEDARSKVADVPADPQAKLVEAGSGTVALQVRDNLDEAWHRVRVSLDRIGFMVERSDRDKRVYYVRYNDVWEDQETKGFFDTMFGGKKEDASKQYQVRLSPEGETTDVKVFSADGAPENSATGGKILSALYDQLK